MFPKRLDWSNSRRILAQARVLDQTSTALLALCARWFLGLKNNSSSTRKKVVIRKLDNSVIKGYADSASYLGPQGVEILDSEGRLVKVPLCDLKGIFFVRDFVGNRQRNERKVFQSRPRSRGLWVRMTFTDKEVLEGIIPNDLLELEAQGFLVTPPDVHSNNLKIYVPRTALTALEVVAVISDGATRRAFRRSFESRRPSAFAPAPIDLIAASKVSQES
jgi:uncharacterized protein DUF6982